MKVKKMKRIFAFMLAAVMTVSLAACGSKAEQNSSSGDESGSDYVWVPSYENLDTDTENGYVTDISLIDGNMYYRKVSWDEETQTSTNFICKKALGQGASEEVLYSGTEEDSISHFTVLADGKIVLVLSSYNMEEEKNYWSLQIVDTNGEKISSADITDAISSGDEWAYVDECISDAKGNIYLQSEGKVLVYDNNGGFLFAVEAKENWIQGIGLTKDGSVAVLQNSSNGMDLSIIDTDSKDYGATYQGIPDNMSGNGIAPGLKKDLLLNMSGGLIEYDFASQSYEELFTWLDCDINPDYVEYISTTEDGKILALIREWDSEEDGYQLCTLTKTPKSEVPEKQIITLGTMYLSQGLQNAIVKFNKTNNEYRITVVDYSKTVDDSQENADSDALVKFNNDIMTGNAPDIIDLAYGNYTQYMKQGIIEDLYPYLEQSTVISKEDFMPSILEGYSVDGKLSCIPSSFYLNTLIAKTADVGEKQGWTIDELIALIDSKPEDMQIMLYATKTEILRMCMMFDEESYIDWGTGKCKFDSEEFKKVLEFANRFPLEYNWQEDMPSEPALIAEGKLLLMQATLSSMNDIQTYTAMYGGEDITYIGYPTADGSGGNAFVGEDTLGISSKSANKEGAWEFLQSLLSEEHQTGMFSWGLPTLQSAFDKELEKAMEKQYQLDEEGNPVLDEEGNPIEASHGGMSYGDGWSVDYYAVTPEEAEQLKALINSTKRVTNYNSTSEVFSIIAEEAAPYFAGQKSLDEVVGIIQSRVQIYISENM